MTQLGKYELHEILGKGGFGTVYRAFDSALDRQVAIKALHPQLALPDFLESFRKEARLLAGLRHPNIVTVYELGAADGRIFLVMEYLPGGSLERRLRESGPLPLEAALAALEQAAAGLETVHRHGLLHRDIKPANLIFNADGQVVITDFGLAHSLAATSTSAHAGGAGTPLYKAPEIWQGAADPGPAADVYSLGCVFFEMLAGRSPFAGQTVDETLARHLALGPDWSCFPDDGLPPGLQAVVARALVRRPEERFAGASAFAQAARAAAAVRHPAQPAARPAGDAPVALRLPGAAAIEFCLIPAGEFLLGSDLLADPQAREDELPGRRVRLEEFYVAASPVTNQQYAAYLAQTGAAAPAHWHAGRIPAGRDDHPVAHVSWDDACAFCAWLDQLVKLQLGVGLQARLPSEAEWEKAARGRDSRLYPWGNQPPNADLANYGYIVYNTTPVQKYRPQGQSPYGCADMAGNVLEWTLNGYDFKQYERDARRAAGEPVEAATSGAFRALRGGSWQQEAAGLRAACREFAEPETRAAQIGFRCVLAAPV